MKHNTFFTNTGRLQLICAFAVLLGMSSCEKEVHIDLGTTAPHVVVQGAIETALPPYVVLTSTISFFSTVDLTTLQNSFLHDANVTVSDGSKTVALHEYALDTGNSIKFYVYTLDTTGAGGVMLGETGKVYSLSVTYGGKTYTAVSKIPNSRGVDSAWFARPENVRDRTPATAQQLFVNYTDPDTSGDCVRYFTSRGNDTYYASGIFSDEVVNGKVVNNIGLFAGYQDNDQENRNADSVIYFFPGESVSLKWCNIDKAVYKFYNSLEFARNAVGNPFSSPINLISNISNGGLGVWVGYGTTVKNLVVPQ